MNKEIFMKVFGDHLLEDTCQLTPRIHAINESGGCVVIGMPS